jgi:hypothetical protein
MNPAKFREVIHETAQRLELPPEMVAAVMQTALTSLSHTRVQVLNLGTFQLKPRAIQKKLCSKKQRIELTSTLPDSHYLETIQQDVEALEKALDMLEREKERKHHFKKNRQSHEQQDQPHRTLEKEG